MTVGILIPIRGDAVMQQYDDSAPTSLQDLVQGYFEIITLPSGLNLCVNEDGNALGLEINVQASNIARRLIVGPALLCGEIRRGRFTSLSASIINQYVP